MVKGSNQGGNGTSQVGNDKGVIKHKGKGKNSTQQGSNTVVSNNMSSSAFSTPPPGGSVNHTFIRRGSAPNLTTEKSLTIYYVPSEARIQFTGKKAQILQNLVPNDTKEHQDLLKQYLEGIKPKPDMILITEYSAETNENSLANEYQMFSFRCEKERRHDMTVFMRKSMQYQLRLGNPFISPRDSGWAPCEYKDAEFGNGRENTLNKNKRVAYRAIIQTLCNLLGYNFDEHYTNVLSRHYETLESVTAQLGSYFMLNFNARNILFAHMPNGTITDKLMALLPHFPNGAEHLFDAILGDLNFSKVGGYSKRIFELSAPSGIYLSKIEDADAKNKSLRLSNHTGAVGQNVELLSGEYPKQGNYQVGDHKGGLYKIAVTSRLDYTNVSIETHIDQLIEYNFDSTPTPSYETSAATHKFFVEKVQTLLKELQSKRQSGFQINTNDLANKCVPGTPAIQLLGIPGYLEAIYVEHVVQCLQKRQFPITTIPPVKE
jgi:hypothetical protein